jgi:hypothetical protein
LGDSDFRVLEVLLHKGPLPVNSIGPKVFAELSSEELQQLESILKRVGWWAEALGGQEEGSE